MAFRAGLFNLFNQAFPRFQQGPDVFNDVSLTLDTRRLVRVDNVPNGAGGTRNQVCDPSGGFRFTDGRAGDSTNTVRDFGRITNKHGHRVIELAVKFYF